MLEEFGKTLARGLFINIALWMRANNMQWYWNELPQVFSASVKVDVGDMTQTAVPDIYIRGSYVLARVQNQRKTVVVKCRVCADFTNVRKNAIRSRRLVAALLRRFSADRDLIGRAIFYVSRWRLFAGVSVSPFFVLARSLKRDLQRTACESVFRNVRFMRVNKLSPVLLYLLLS